MRNVLMAALGSTGGQTDAEVQRLHVEDKDQVLLCTDGLTALVDDETIGLILRAEDSADRACKNLIDTALTRGGTDNATVVLARYRFPQTEQHTSSTVSDHAVSDSQEPQPP
jgi:protein phosphatase